MKSGYVFINNNIFSSLLAESEHEQERGLMHEPWPPPIMSFVYNKPKVNKFWMHNTPSPLDIVFCCNGKVIDICAGEPNSTRVIGPDNCSDLIIELPKGTVESSGIKIGHSAGIVASRQFLK
jgi:uncharacterized membrane protein (UPF0127 family)